MSQWGLPPMTFLNKSRPSRRTLLTLLGTVVVLSATALGISRALSVPPAAPVAALPADTFKPTDTQLASFKIMDVTAMSFQDEQLAEGKIALNGDKTTAVFSPFSGRVIQVLVNPGDTVKAGQSLMVVEATEFAQAVNDLVAARAALMTAKTQFSQAQVNERRKHGLFDARAGSLADWEQSRSDLVAAEGNLKIAETALTLVRNRLKILGKTGHDIDALESASGLSAHASVNAPISGTITDRQVGPGQYIQSGSANPVFSIGDISSLWLMAQVREVDAPHMKVGAPVEVRVLAVPGKVYRAKIVAIAPVVDANTRRVALRAVISNADGELKPEMFANFRIITGNEKKSPGVPESAVVFEGETARVWVAGDNGTIGLRNITVGRRSGEMLEVVAGLNVGEKIVTSGTLFIDRAVRGE
jgi:cobalt-zinc-cadmium efflux system membrane fusion protein